MVSRTRIATKVNTILIATLAAGVGLILAAFAINLVSSRNQRTRRSLLQEANDLFTSIANFMVHGEFPLAVKFISQVADVNPGSRILLFRQNGAFAFSDNTTILRVNSNLGVEKFKARDGDPAPREMPAKPHFADAATTPPVEMLFRDDVGGKSYFRAYRPLINLPKRRVCHGSDHTVRGVIGNRSDITDEVNGQNILLAGASGGLFVVVGLLALLDRQTEIINSTGGDTDKEVFANTKLAAGEKPIQLTIMAKNPKDPRAQEGWLWVTKALPDGAETVFSGNFCVTRHQNANEAHPYGDKNKSEEFRDYVYYVPGEIAAGSLSAVAPPNIPSPSPTFPATSIGYGQAPKENRHEILPKVGWQPSIPLPNKSG